LGATLRRNVFVVFALLALFGLGGGLWEAHQARLQAAKASAVKEFLLSIFDQPGIGERGEAGQRVTFEQILDTGADRIHRELKDSPDVRDELLIELAELYTRLEAYPKAEALYREAVTLVHTEHGPHSLEAADARVRLARSMGDQQRYSEADALLIQAAADAAGSGERRALVRARALVSRCEISFFIRTLEGPEGLRTAQQAARLLEGIDSPRDRVDSLYALARMHENLGHFAEAADITGRALSLAQVNRAEAGDRIPRGRQMRARMLRAMGRYTEGEAEIARAAEQLSIVAGASGNHAGEAGAELAIYLDRRGAHTEAIPVLRQTMERLRVLRSADDPLSIQSEVDLGAALVRAGREAEADELLSGTTRLRAQPARARFLATAQLAHGRALALLGDPAAAAEAYEEARALRAKEGNEDDALTAPPLLGLAEVALQQGALDAAERFLRSAALHLAPAVGSSAEGRRQARVDSAALALARGKSAEALAEARKLVSETEVDPERPYLHAVESAALVLAARSAVALGHPSEAVTPAGRAVELRRHTQWEGSPLLVEARLLFAEALAGTGDVSRAREILAEARTGAALQPRAARPFRAQMHRVDSLTQGSP
jgi:serine/threonine-protein kinase